MANTKISQELPANTLSGTEITEVVQGGNNRRATVQDIANLAFVPFGTTGSGNVALADNPAISITATGGSTSATLANRFSRILDVLDDFGAVGDGVTDDTAALQAAINAAIAGNHPLNLCGTNYKITSPLTINGHLHLFGTGYQSDSGVAYNPPGGVTQTTGWKCATIVPTAAFDAFVITTNQSVILEKFQIVYPFGIVSAGSNATAISISAASGETSINMHSVFRDLWIYGPDIAISLMNCAEWTMDCVHFEQHFTCGVSVDGVNFPSAGDWTITACTFLSGSTTRLSHVRLLATGSGRFVNNKFNTGGSVNTTYGVLVNPTHYVAPSINNPSGGYDFEPLIFTGNSMEGLTAGIYFFGGSPSVENSLISNNGSATQVVITGNQIWCQIPILATGTTTGDGGRWVSGMTICGNFLTCGVSPSNGIQLDGVADTNIVGNFFATAIPEGTATAVALVPSPNTTDIRQSGNNNGPGVTLGPVVTTPVMPASTVAATNTYPTMIEISLYQGNGSNVEINGSQVFNQSSGPFSFSFNLNPGETIAITYTSQPAWVWRAINP